VQIEPDIPGKDEVAQHLVESYCVVANPEDFWQMEEFNPIEAVRESESIAAFEINISVTAIVQVLVGTAFPITLAHLPWRGC